MRLGLEAGGDTLEAAVELGVAGVPVNAADLVGKGVEATLAPLRERSLSVCQIGAFGVNPLSDDEAAQREARAMLREAIPLARESGCPYIVVCGGNHHPSGFGAWDPRNDTDEALERVASVLEPLLALAAEHGAKLSIEPYLKTAINSPERFAALHARLGGPAALVANVDVTSLYDFRDYAAPAARCRAVCEGFAGHYGLLHVKDIVLADGFHLDMKLGPLGSSPTDWAEVLAMSAPHLPEDSWLILEHVPDIEGARRDVARLRAFATDAGLPLS